MNAIWKGHRLLHEPTENNGAPGDRGPLEKHPYGIIPKCSGSS